MKKLIKNIKSKFSKKSKESGIKCTTQNYDAPPNIQIGTPIAYAQTTVGNNWTGIGGTYRDAPMPSESKLAKGQERLYAKPVDVLNELEKIPNDFSLVGINGKIAMLKEKEKLINQTHAKSDVKKLIQCLENRKKYNLKIKAGTKTYREFFAQFDITNDSKIMSLLEKYTLCINDAQIFIPEFPDEAVKIMAEYKTLYKELTGKEPVFKVIATEDSFQKTVGRRDPILLCESPFGLYYCILGAWDKEMMYLPEL